MTKRKLSTYNLHMKRQMARGKSFKAAARSWKKPRSKTGTKRAKTTRKRKVYKVRRRTVSMPRRKTARRRTRRSSSFGLGKAGNFLFKTGVAFSIGAGTSQLVDFFGAQFNIPQARKFAPLAGAIAAASSSPGLPGLAAAFPLITASGLLSGATNGNGGGGVGVFV